MGWFLVGSLRTALCGFVPHVSGDPDLIQSSPHQAYYRISIDSKKWWAWGLGGAPVEEPSAQNRGYGWDAIAIPFDARGRVEFAPVYIYTIIPEAFEEARPGASTKVLRPWRTCSAFMGAYEKFDM